MLETVLVPLDGSPAAEQAIPYAKALLASEGAIALLRVVPEADPMLTELHWSLAASDDAGMTAARKALQQVIARQQDGHLIWTSRTAQGDPAGQILQEISRDAIDVVVMATHGRGAIARALFGSVADRVSRESPVPVLLVRPQPEGAPSGAVEIRRLVVPLDGSPLAEDALPLAAEIARRHAAPVHFVRAVDLAAQLAPLAGEGMLSVSPSPEVYEQLTTGLTTDARNYLASVAERLEREGVTTTWAVLEGSPYFAIAGACQPGDLIVLTSHGRGGALRWLMGSVAEKLARDAPAPVLLVPSRGRGVEPDAGIADGKR